MLMPRQVAYEPAVPQRPTRPRVPGQRQRQAGIRPLPAARPVPLRAWVGGFLLWLAAVGVCIAYVGRQAESARLGIAMSEMKAQTARLARENDLLTAEVHRLKSITRIAAIATAPVESGGLGMVAPRNLQVAVVDRSVLAQPQVAQVPAADSVPVQAGGGIWSGVKAFFASFHVGSARAAAAGAR